MKRAGTVFLLALILCLGLTAAGADGAEIPFTSGTITLDGQAEDAWKDAAEMALENAFGVTTSFDWSTWSTKTTLTPKEEAGAGVSVKTLWNGNCVYLLIDVTDSYVGSNDKVMIGLDLLNDKLPLTEEDDALITVTPASESVSVSWGGLNTPRYQRLAEGSAVHKKTDAEGNVTGYVAELGFYVSDYAFTGGERLGFDISVSNYGAHVYSGTDNEMITYYTQQDIGGDNKGNLYGTVVLGSAGEEAWEARPVDPFVLSSLIGQAEALPKGIWADETALNSALSAAKAVQADKAASRADVDSAAQTLRDALEGMRHVDRVSGSSLPDLKDTPVTENLPDPFTFLNGDGVTRDTWADRAEEIRDMAQYYEYGFMPGEPDSVTASYDPENGTVTVNVTVGEETRSFNANLYLPAEVADFCEDGKIPVLVNLFFGFGSANNQTVSAGGYAQAAFTYTSVAADNASHTGLFYDLYPYDASEYADRGTLVAWAWGASRLVDALEYLDENDPALQGKLDLSRIGVTGQSRLGKASLVAGLMDERFGVTAPQESGSGGAGTYRYINYSTEEYPLQYSWASSPASGSEVLPHRPRNQGWNHNEMLFYALDDRWFGEDFPDTRLGTRLPYDKNLVLSAIAPRGLYVICSNNDDANNSYGDSVSYEGALPVYQALGVEDYLALDVGMNNAGHSTSADQFERLVEFMNWYFYGREMSVETKTKLHTDPFNDEGGYARYGGLDTMLENYTGYTFRVRFDGNGGEGEMADVFVPENGALTLPENGFTAPEGRTFDTWDAGAPGTVMTVTADTTVTAQWKQIPNVYTIIPKAGTTWYKGSSRDLDFTVKGSPDDSKTFERYLGILIDGEAPGSAGYTAGPGSLALSLKASALEKMSVGTHRLHVDFTDGYAEIRFNVEPKETPYSPGGYSHKFTFTKIWQGGQEESIDWTLYASNDTIVHKGFRKRVVSETEWRYEAWFPTGEEYYIIENVPAGYRVRYENVGKYAGVTDRCCNGGTIINYKVPKTGDSADPILWMGCAVLGLALLTAAYCGRRGKFGEK